MNKLYNILFSVFTLLVHQVLSADPSNQAIAFIPAAVQNGPSQGQFISSGGGLDAPKVKPINGSAYDWWYFDAVSDDAKSSIVVVFYTASSAGVPAESFPSTINSVSINAEFPNGTSFAVSIPAGNATIVTVGDGTTGSFEGTGCGWTSTPDVTQYLLYVDAPSFGIKGTIELHSVAPAHYPCGTAVRDQSLAIMPDVGWANAVPDSRGVINFVINGSQFEFTGAGYHDKNWGVVPFPQSVGSWYWGHGRLGEYSIVWYDALTPSGTEFLSIYIACDRKIIYSQCSGLQVRPTGANSTYPPTLSSGNPTGFYIAADLGNEGILEVEVSNEYTTVLTAPYKRWTGQLKGGFQGSEVLTGVALYEQFAFNP
ncbi:hypothetical protein OIDMADRAFT_139186 [Oidiodendron maius Zn]|uniref:AttH domain-containing protein n=1 Tax=Oidiodendron maius (strain Zn) TaxID=913774 RepID=A0A0C3GQC9_OIDMZ|nr:hypothetical protein OIDMADRAFT_139186 [Oidiodendron maius Zn]